jgi:ubiquinone/menaquinone biosynthesis C-methylase UbiE
MDPTKFQFNHPDVPKHYEHLFVPRFFTQWGEYLLTRTGAFIGARVLDVACGPGTVTRLAAARVGVNGRVTGADISSGMLEVARSKGAVPGGVAIEYIESPAAPLAVKESAFDVALCQQGFQFFPDRVAAARELHRVLSSNGTAGVAVWTSLERNPLFAMIHAALEDVLGKEVADWLRPPFSWPSLSDVEDTLRAGGFGKVRGETMRFPVVFEGGPAQVSKLVRATPFWGLVDAAPEANRAKLDGTIQAGARAFMDGQRVRSELESNVVVATK